MKLATVSITLTSEQVRSIQTQMKSTTTITKPKQHGLSVENRIKGIKAALKSPKTPLQLKAGLKKHLKTLQAA